MLLKNFLFNNLSQGLQFGTRWFLSLTLIVVLGVDDFATFSFVYSASNIMLAVFPFGSSVFLISDTNNESKKIEILLDSLFVVVLIFITFLIFYILTFSFVEDVKGWNYIGFSLFLSLFLAINFLLFSYFKSLGDFKKELTAYLVFAGLLLLFIAYLIFFPRGEQMISLILSLLIGINMIVTIIGFTYLAKSNSYTFEGVRAPSLKKIIIIFNERRYFGLQEIVTAIYTQSGMLILFYLLDDIVYGYYRALYVIVAPAFMITVALSQVVLSQFKIYKGLILISNFRKTQKYTIVFGFLLTAFFYLFKPFIFNFLNLDSNSSFNIAYLFILAIILIRFFFVNYEMFLVVVNKQKQRFLVMLVSALFSILLMFLLLPKYGLIGALVINTISYAIVLIGTSFIAEKKDKINFKKMTVTYISSRYPSKNNPYNHMFVHMRCLEMLKQGVEIVVYVPSTIAHTYVYEGITVNCLPSKDIIKHLTNKDKLYLHLLNIYPFSKKNGWIIYKHILDKHIPAVFYVHGSEVQKYGSRIFEFRYRIKDFLIWLKKDFLVIPKMKVFVKTALKRENIKFIYPSIWMKEDMEVNLGVAIPYFKIIPNGIDVDLFSYQETYENRYKMLTLRPLSSKKYAVDIAIKIMSFLPNNYTLDIYGKGFYKKQYLEQIKALKLEDRIKINSSFIDRNDLNSFFSKYGVFLCPTRMDAQGVTMCEAMATGLLTVSSLNTAIPEFITHLDNGIIGNNLEAIAKNIIDNTESMEKYKNITIRARKSMENIAIHKTVAREIEVFCKL